MSFAKTFKSDFVWFTYIEFSVLCFPYLKLIKMFQKTHTPAILNLEMSVSNEPMFFCLEVCSNVYDCKIILSLKIWTLLCFRNLKTIFQKIQSRNCLLDSLMSWQQRVQSMTRHKCFLQKPLPQKMWLLGCIHLSHCLEVGASSWKALYIGLNSA